MKDGYDSIGFRPENAEIVEEQTQDSVEGTVKYSEYQGEETIVYVDVGNSTVRIKDRQNRTYEPGCKVYIKIKRSFAFTDGKVVNTVQL